MRPLRALFVMSMRQALPVKRTIALVVIQLLPTLVYLLSTQNRTEAAALDSFVTIGAAMLLGLAVPITSIVIGSGAVGAERRDETLSFLALRPISRTALAATKTVAAIIASTAIGLVGALVFGAAHVLQHGDASLIGGMAYGVLIASAIYTAVLVPLGFLTDRAVLIALVYLFVFEGGAVSLLPALASVSPWRIGLSAFGGVASNPPSITDDLTGSLQLSVLIPLVTVIAVTVISIAITALMLRQRDLA